MAVVEIDEDRLKALTGAHNLMDQLMRDPKTRGYTEKLIKAKFPNVTTSEDDPRVKEMRALAGTVNKFIDDQQRDKIQGKLDATFERLRSEYKYTDEGIDKIKKIMVDESIANPEAAAAWWEKKNPPKPMEPAGYEPNNWDFNPNTDDEDLKMLWADDDRWLNREIGRTIADARKGVDE